MRKHPGRILVQKNSLCAKVAAAPGIGTAFQTLWENQPNAAQMLWFCYGDTTYRNNGGIPIDPTNCLQQSIDTGVSYGTKFIEIYQVDVLNLPTVIDYAHSVL